jgi:hypothetical protein
MFVVWLVGWFLLAIFFVGHYAWIKEGEPKSEGAWYRWIKKESDAQIQMILGIFFGWVWPLAAVIIILSSPLWGVYYGVRYFRRKAREG